MFLVLLLPQNLLFLNFGKSLSVIGLKWPSNANPRSMFPKKHSQYKVPHRPKFVIHSLYMSNLLPSNGFKVLMVECLTTWGLLGLRSKGAQFNRCRSLLLAFFSSKTHALLSKHANFRQSQPMSEGRRHNSFEFDSSESYSNYPPLEICTSFEFMYLGLSYAPIG